MAGFRRRTSKTTEENQVAENQGELEMSTSVDDKAESSNEQNLSESATSEQNNESEESVPVKKKRTIVKKVSDSQKHHLQQTLNQNQSQNPNRKYNNRSYSRNIPQETLQTETHLPENMQDYESKPRLEINELTKKGMQELFSFLDLNYLVIFL